jgi:hypothetical protein
MDRRRHLTDATRREKAGGRKRQEKTAGPVGKLSGKFFLHTGLQIAHGVPFRSRAARDDADILRVGWKLLCKSHLLLNNPGAGNQTQGNILFWQVQAGQREPHSRGKPEEVLGLSKISREDAEAVAGSNGSTIDCAVGATLLLFSQGKCQDVSERRHARRDPGPGYELRWKRRVDCDCRHWHLRSSRTATPWRTGRPDRG